MALQTDVIDIPLTGGLSEHVDAKLVEPGSFLTLQNVEYTAAGGLKKRTGYGTLPTTATDTYTVPAPLALDVVGGELVMVGSRPADTLQYEACPYLWSWSSSLSKWSPRSSVCPLVIKRRAAVRSFRDLASSTPNVARTSNGLEVWAWAENGNTYYRVTDSATGTVLLDEAVVLTGFTGFVIMWTGTAVTLVYVDRTDIRRMRFDPTALTWGTDVAVYTAAANITVIDVAPLPTSDYWTASYYDSAGPTVRTLRIYDPTPSVTHNVAVATGGGAPTHIATIANSTIVAVAWNENVAGVLVRSAAVADLAAVWPATVVDVPTGSFATLTVGIETNSTIHVCWASSVIGLTTYALSTRSIDSTFTFVSSVRRVYHARPASRPWRAPDGNLYMLAGSFFSGDADHFGYVVLCLTQHDESGYVLRPIKVVGAVANVDGRRILYGSFPHPAVGATTTEAVFPIGVQFDLTSYRTVDAVTLDVATVNESLWRGAYASGLLLQSGGLLGSYDGSCVVETGFVQPPRWNGLGYGLTYGAAPGVEGDAVLTHIYEYVAVYRWRDAKGLVHQSRPSAPLLVSINNGGGFNQALVTLDVQTTALTRRADANDGAIKGIAIVVYRSLKNTTGAHYQIAWEVTDMDGVDVYSRQITDTETDAVLLAAARGQLYTDGGVFDNDMPPPSRYTHAHGGRLWIVSSEDDREVWASKLLVKDEAPAFSAYLRVRVEDSASEVVALGSLNDELVIFTRTGVYLLSGPGTNDAGGGEPFEAPRLVSSSAGCLDARSVVSWQGGVFFQSKEGLCLLGTNGITWVGQAAKDTLASYPNIRHAQLDPKRRRITWLCDDGTSGITLWHDYQHNAWGTFAMASDPRTLCETVWSNLRVVGDTDGTHMESYGSYPGRDPGQAWITARIETPWIRLGAVGGFQRVKRVVVTGDTLGSHVLTMSLYNDWGTLAVQTEAITQTTSVVGPERCVLVVASQKCSAVKVRLQDSAGDLNADVRAGSWISGLSLQIGRKEGVAKLAPGSWKLWVFWTKFHAQSASTRPTPQTPRRRPATSTATPGAPWGRTPWRARSTRSARRWKPRRSVRPRAPTTRASRRARTSR